MIPLYVLGRGNHVVVSLKSHPLKMSRVDATSETRSVDHLGNCVFHPWFIVGSQIRVDSQNASCVSNWFQLGSQGGGDFATSTHMLENRACTHVPSPSVRAREETVKRKRKGARASGDSGRGHGKEAVDGGAGKPGGRRWHELAG